MKSAWTLIAIGTLELLLVPASTQALDPSLDVNQYAHTAWTSREGFPVGATFAIAQTPDGYLWLGSEFGLYRFDGVHAVLWQPPAGQQRPQKPYALLVSRDGTLWIGTFAGLVSWDGITLTQYPEIGGDQFVTSLLEDRQGTVWVATMATPGRLCAVRSGNIQCYGEGDLFGTFVWSLSEDSSGILWIGAESGLWRWDRGSLNRYATPAGRIGDITVSADGRLLFGISGAGLKLVVDGKISPFPIYSGTHPGVLLSDREVDSNKLLQDRDGGLWIGTHQRGLIHLHKGKTDVFTTSDGLSGDIGCSLFEDREGNIWYASSRGLDRFRELPVTSISAKQGLSSDYALSVLAATDGSIWIGTRDGLRRWAKGQTTIFHKGSGLPDDGVQSLFQDYRGRIWATFNRHGLAYFDGASFVPINSAIPSTEVYSIAGDNKGHLWLSGNRALSYIRDGRVVENFPWSVFGRQQQAKVVVFDRERGGIWLAFWQHGGVLFFKDGQIRASYTPADGLGKGPVGSIQLSREALWAATQEGGLSRIKDGHIATLSTENGLPCDTIHWSIEDDDRSLWLYAACGLVRISANELQAWIADPKRRVQTTLWGAEDGVTLRSTSPGYYNPAVAKSTDGSLWFNTGEGVGILNPRHLAFNKNPPPVHIEQVIADHKSVWQNLHRTTVPRLRLPPRIRDLQIDYTALSFVAPEKVRFRYKLEGQDQDWREAVNDRQVQYSNLDPGTYRFRVLASNNSGVWNEQGDTLEFSIAPAYFQSNWFRALCAGIFLVLLWAGYQLRVRQLSHQFEITLNARVGERARIARELHDTLLQSFQGLLLRFQTASQLLPERPKEAKDKLDSTIEQAADAITEGRNAVQGLRDSAVQSNDLALVISALGTELEGDISYGEPAAFRVAVEGEARNLHPIIRDETYKIAAEALRNAFRHAKAKRVEVDLRYDSDQFRLRVRDDGRGIDPAVLSGKDTGHYGLHGMRERATVIGGKLVVWSKADTGTEVELCVPGSVAYVTPRKASWFSREPKGNA